MDQPHFQAPSVCKPWHCLSYSRHRRLLPGVAVGCLCYEPFADALCLWSGGGLCLGATIFDCETLVYDAMVLPVLHSFQPETAQRMVINAAKWGFCPKDTSGDIGRMENVCSAQWCPYLHPTETAALCCTVLSCTLLSCPVPPYTVLRQSSRVVV